MTLERFRVYLMLAGLVLAVAAVTLADERVTWFAIAVLVVAFGLKFAKKQGAPPAEPPPE